MKVVSTTCSKSAVSDVTQFRKANKIAATRYGNKCNMGLPVVFAAWYPNKTNWHRPTRQKMRKTLLKLRTIFTAGYSYAARQASRQCQRLVAFFSSVFQSKVIHCFESGIACYEFDTLH